MKRSLTRRQFTKLAMTATAAVSAPVEHDDSMVTAEMGQHRAEVRLAPDHPAVQQEHDRSVTPTVADPGRMSVELDHLVVHADFRRQLMRLMTPSGACFMNWLSGDHGHGGMAESTTSFSMALTMALQPVSVSTISRAFTPSFISDMM